MTKRNPNLAKLQAGYLFPEINRRKKRFLEQNPDADIISLGIGNTTEPITPYIAEALKKAAIQMGTKEGYSGYGEEQGLSTLRQKIAEKLYKGIINPDEVFISDGAKCDIGRLQIMFGSETTIALQNPSYPVYIDGSVIIGATGNYNLKNEQFDNVIYMECSPKNDFFPNLKNLPKTDLIYFCSPNNPTGAVATHEQLEMLVKFAKDNNSIIMYDAAYSEYIKDKKYPKTIYSIKGSREVAIEVNSFSKSIGFTGIRLGWSVIPKELKYDDGTSIANDWNRIVTTIFNGASNIVQLAALAALEDKGLEEMKKTIDYYMTNAGTIKQALTDLGIKTYGGINAPYIWAEFPGKKSWDVFEEILTKSHIITTPGSGFGPAGESFIRFSAFGHNNDIQKAVQRLKETFKS